MKLKTKNLNGKRFYITPEGSAYPSITSVLSTIPNPGIEAWRQSVGESVADYVLRISGLRGTQMHAIIEDYLGGMKDLDELHKKYPKILPWGLFLNIKPEIDRIHNIKSLEDSVWSDELKVAGRFDCAADYNLEGPCIIDFKTASKLKDEDMIESYFLQASFYSYAYLERYGVDIPKICIIMSCESGEKAVFIKNRNDYMERLKCVLYEYHNST